MELRIAQFSPRGRWLLAIGVLLPMVLVLAGLMTLTAPAAAVLGTNVNGPIDVPTTWTQAGSPYVVTGTVTILDTAVLTITEGVQVRFQWETSLVAEGPLRVLGSDASPVIFTSDLDPPPPTAWDGITLIGGGNVLQHCQVEYGYYGLYIHPTSDGNLVADCLFQFNGHWEGPVGGAILGSTDYSQFLRNEIGGSPFGILLVESSHNTIADNEIGFLGGTGVGLQGQAGAFATGNTVTGNFVGRLVGEGLSFLYQSDLVVADNLLYQAADGSSPGPLAGPLAEILIDLPIAGGLSVRSCDGVIVTGNDVTETGWGRAPTYRAGVYIHDTTALTLDGNFVHLNMGDGLEYAAANGSAPTIHNNGFWDNEFLELESFYPSAIDVTGNWWGTDLPIPGDHLSGTLLYTPWVTLALTAHPTMLPADGASQADVTVTMVDGAGHHAPDGLGVDLETSLGTLSAAGVSLSSGVGVAQLTSALSPGTAWLTATAPLPSPGMTTTIPSGRQAFAWVQFTLTLPHTLTLTANPTVIPADGISTSTLRAEVLDSEGDPVDDGTTVVFSTTLGTFPGGPALTLGMAGEPRGGVTQHLTGTAMTSGGVATITLTSAITPGTALVTACAPPACDSTTVRFRGEWSGSVYVPMALKNHPLPPPPSPDCYTILLATSQVGFAPHGVAFNRPRNLIYVADHDSDSLTVIDGVSYSPATTVDAGDGPNGVAYNPANDLIYVANHDTNSVTVLRASDYGPEATVPVGLQPNGVAVNEVTNRVYVANYGDGTVSVIDGVTNTELWTVTVGVEPAMVAVNPLTNKAYVSLHGEGKVAVIDGAGNMSQVSVYSNGPYGIAVDALRNYVYVAAIDDFRVAVIDGSTDTFLGWAEIRRLPNGEPVPLRMIAVNPLIGVSGHIFLTTAGEDGGWNRFLLLPKGWDEYFARAYALPLNEPREGIAFDAATRRVFVTSRGDNRLAVYLDGEPACDNNFLRQGAAPAAAEEYQITVCVADPDGTCREIITR